MDEDTVQLVRQLSTRAGILMEDMSTRAILVGPLNAQDLADLALEIERTGSGIIALTHAMHVLLGSQSDDDVDHRVN